MQNSKNSEIINYISNDIWNIINIVRGSLPVHDFHVMLFLLSAHNDDVLVEINTEEYFGDLNFSILNAIKHNSKYNIFLDVYAPIIKKIPQDKLKVLLYYFMQINNSSLNENFAEIFDKLLYRILEIQGKYSGEFFQPLEISRFIINLANLPENASVYNPFAGLASFGTLLNNKQIYYAQENNSSTWALGKLRLIARKLDDSNFDLEDSIEHWNNSNKFDLIISNPPFGVKLFGISRNPYENGITTENFLIEHGIESINQNGQLICLLPQGFLFRGGRDQRLRKELIDNNLIDTIISLPAGLLKHTGIPACIIIFNKIKKDKIKLVDASDFISSINARDKRLDDTKLTTLLKNEKSGNKFVKLVALNEIQKSDYNLSVQRYFVKENDLLGLKLVPEIGENLMGSRVSKNEFGKLVRIRNLKDDVIDCKLDTKNIEIEEIRLVGSRKINESCLLLATKWKTLKPTFFKFEDDPIFINNDIIALRIDEDKVVIHYLINELHKEYVKDQINSYRTSSISPLIRKEDLFNIRINLPSIDEQNEQYNLTANRFMISKVEELNSVYNAQLINVNDENSFLRHQIAGSLKSVRGSFKFIRKIIEEKIRPDLPGLYELKADDKLESTLLTYLDNLERDLTSINKSVNRAGDKIDLMDLHIENFDLLLFIKEYKKGLEIRSKNFYTVSLDLDENAIFEFGISAIHIEGDKDLLRKMLDNIIENAEKHAFLYGINNDNENKIEINMNYDLEDFTVQVNISNTGKPLSQNITHESYTRKGSTTGTNAGDGTGGWFINEVMKIHKGKFSFTDETGPEGLKTEFVTTIELNFPIIPAI